MTVEETLFNMRTRLMSEKHVTPLLLVESGSRVWGWSNEYSDYDVRGVHVSTVDAYLGLKPPPEQVKLDFIEGGVTFDVESWDIKKFLGLLMKSNPQISEWLSSNQIYYGIETLNVLKPLFLSGFSAGALERHYLNLARANYMKFIKPKEAPNLKKYVYVLRALGCLLYLRKNFKVPPLHYTDTIGYLPDWVQKDMRTFVQLKVSGEQAYDRSNPSLNEWIESHWLEKCLTSWRTLTCSVRKL